MSKLIKKKTIKESKTYYGHDIPCDFMDFISWCNERVDEIPAKYRKDINIYIDTTPVPYEDYEMAEIEISYKRDMTDREIAEKEFIEKDRKEVNRERDLAEFERLKNLLGK